MAQPRIRSAWAALIILLGFAATLVVAQTAPASLSTAGTSRLANTATDGGALSTWSSTRLIIAACFIVALIALVWLSSRRSTMLRDNLLPQLNPSKQTYSLARWQMAFWFILVLAAFVVLFLLSWDTNTINGQALLLMGISGGTALSSVSVDAAKESPADAVNRGLRALGLGSYDDVLQIRAEIAQRRQLLTSMPAPANAEQLQTEIQDRQNVMRLYEDQVRPFVTQGWFRDLTTDINGVTLHRLQVFCWTWVVGAVFVIEVWRTRAMPEFNSYLLALLGISNAGYVALKIPEVNS